MNYIQKTCLVLTIVGGINWGLVGLFDFNLVTFITQGYNIFSRIIYVVICAAALVNIMLLFMDLRQKEKYAD